MRGDCLSNNSVTIMIRSWS